MGHDTKMWGNVDPLKHYAPIQILCNYEEYKTCDFAVIRPDCDGGFYVDIACGMGDIPNDSVAFFVLPENNF